MHGNQEFVLKLEAPDRPGIMSRVTPELSSVGCDIRGAQVFGDPDTKRFYVRMELSAADTTTSQIESCLETAIEELDLKIEVRDMAVKPKVLIAVSKSAHCLNDILHKWRIGSLPVDIVGIVSNHQTLESTANWHQVPYWHIPITKETKSEQEAAFKAVIDQTGTELVVLARYMQILSDGFSAALSERCINIHHSFLPSFKGAKPYHQAHKRGVKLIGATAHFVTVDLDEGPIIEQDVRRVSHITTASDMVEIGREVEASVLSRAVKWWAEHRVFLSGSRTVVLQ